jgi:hypothetical protein
VLPRSAGRDEATARSAVQLGLLGPLADMARSSREPEAAAALRALDALRRHRPLAAQVGVVM